MDEFNEFLNDLDKWYEQKNKYLETCKYIDDHFGGHDKVPADLGDCELIYETAVEELANVECEMFNKWYNES